MNGTQFRTFRQQVITLIDNILGSNHSTPQSQSVDTPLSWSTQSSTSYDIPREEIRPGTQPVSSGRTELVYDEFDSLYHQL